MLRPVGVQYRGWLCTILTGVLGVQCSTLLVGSIVAGLCAVGSSTVVYWRAARTVVRWRALSCLVSVQCAVLWFRWCTILRLVRVRCAVLLWFDGVRESWFVDVFSILGLERAEYQRS